MHKHDGSISKDSGSIRSHFDPGNLVNESAANNSCCLSRPLTMFSMFFSSLGDDDDDVALTAAEVAEEEEAAAATTTVAVGVFETGSDADDCPRLVLALTTHGGDPEELASSDMSGGDLDRDFRSLGELIDDGAIECCKPIDVPFILSKADVVA